MQVYDAQLDMRSAYYGGGTGVLASSIAWFITGLSAYLWSEQKAIWVLLIAGIFIFPLSLVFCKFLGASGSHVKANPLGQLAASSTIWLIFSMPLAYIAGTVHVSWFFAAMLIVIGARYMVFATLYGTKLYWTLGVILALIGFVTASNITQSKMIVVLGALVELVFAIKLMLNHRQSLQHSVSLRD